jgi:hypothetical protein
MSEENIEVTQEMTREVTQEMTREVTQESNSLAERSIFYNYNFINC